MNLMISLDKHGNTCFHLKSAAKLFISAGMMIDYFNYAGSIYLYKEYGTTWTS